MRHADACRVSGESATLLGAAVTPVSDTCLAGRGLTRSGEKPRLIHLAAGGEGRGPTSRPDHGTRLIHPAQPGVKNRLDHRRGLRTRHPRAPPAPVIRQMKPVLRGWAHAHRHVCRKNLVADVDVPRARARGRGANRRHPTTSQPWMKARDGPSRGGKNGVGTGTEAHGQAIHLRKTAATPLPRQVTVHGPAHPDDPAAADDCDPRRATTWATGSSGHAHLTGLWPRQGGTCPPCGPPLTPDRRWQVHHHIPRAAGGPHPLDHVRF